MASPVFLYSPANAYWELAYMARQGYISNEDFYIAQRLITYNEYNDEVSVFSKYHDKKEN